ncbi:MAG: 50S ribosomal protein L28 [Chloroflexi bacterium]|nr:50S ribosomal protein L28 [Chloroflexota bacterium]
MARCEICLKSGQYGNNVSHSKKRTRTRSLANIQRSKIYDKGAFRQVNICTKCLRNQSKVSSKT